MKARSFSIVSLAVLLFGVTNVIAASTPVVRQIITDSAKAILVTAAKPQFSIQLRSNPTTGYMWVLDARYNHALVKPVSHSFHPSTTKLVGAPGYTTFNFTMPAIAFAVPQKIQISFQYMRPWMATDNAQPLTFTIITQ